jgi:hypothetical protein
LPVRHDDIAVWDDVMVEIRLAEFIMGVSGCTAKRALELVRKTPTVTTLESLTPFDRLVTALAATRADVTTNTRKRVDPDA